MGLRPKPTKQDGQGVHHDGEVHGLDSGSHHAQHVLMAQGPLSENLVSLDPKPTELVAKGSTTAGEYMDLTVAPTMPNMFYWPKDLILRIW